MNPNRKTNLYILSTWMLVLAGACGANHYDATHNMPLPDKETPVIKRTEVVDMKSLDLMKHYIDKATEFDHKRFASKSSIEEARMQDSVVKYRMLIYKLNKENR